MPHRLAYSGTPLDRAAAKRDDDAWLAAQTAENPSVLAVWQDQSLIFGADSDHTDPDAAVISGAAAQDMLRADNAIFLGLKDGAPVFALDLSDLTEQAALDAVGHGHGHGPDGDVGFVDLRQVGPLLDQPTGSMLAFARGMSYWQRRHQFCGICGTKTRSNTGGFVQQCTSADCGVDHFPRTDPAVIMLVTAEISDVEHCLLGRQPSWAEGLYSSLAGFVEPGESLEVAVAREVMEEASIEITDVEYRASQPWPFPSSLMLGFRARATTFDIDVGEDELEDARWFSRDDLHERMRKDAADGKLSRSDSIARWLINDWLNEGS
ncbi:MAG: NAD(+) diphosphatase [Rhodospirillales bacterium]|jgi:NAD+ diphosphatase|nr:NAD(+) diphosphatase [Rhodospirillales bacterium]MBT4039235.1 NAD(+) diphosphatase [Rhodospirillales bacterium]MBT4626937.1 NAD(+) diphosphatase [Rhodospirillales bacterium]MBT5352471.1 NAD(+) diphosphatase [Rhodospirillales bacterium]MBT6111162.1 NAD(+) diphosphatase [Rhodospirillales bacterium]